MSEIINGVASEYEFPFSTEDITFYGDNEKEKELNKKLFEDSLLIAQKDDEIRELKNQLQQKENIIKEVREYINNHFYMESTGGIQHPTFDGKMNSDTDGFEILEILDKVD